MRPIGVQIVDDHPAIQSIIEHTLNHPEFKIVSKVSSIRDAIEESEKVTINFVILDLIFPTASGETLITHYMKKTDIPRMLVYSSMRDLYLPARCIQAGAHGFVDKSSSLEMLSKAITTVAIDKKMFIPEALQQHIDHTSEKENRLTPRENEIVRLIALGLSSHGIAWELDISERTVNVHRTNLMRKINAHCPADVIRFALNQHLIAEEELNSRGRK